MTAPLRGAAFLDGTFPVLTVLVLLLAAGAYAVGIAVYRRGSPRHRWPIGRSISFFAGLAIGGVAICSFLGVYSRVLFIIHMVQHLLLVMVAGPLLALGSPVQLGWLASRGRMRARFSAILRSRPSRLLGHPGFAFLAYAVLIPLTHLTSFYEYTLIHPFVEDVEQLAYLFIGYLFWRQIFGHDPNSRRLEPGVRFLFLFLAIPIDTFTGLSLDSTTHELFPAYAALHRTWGASLVEDLHQGGVLMWVGGDTLMLWPMIPVAVSWLHLEERRAARADWDADLRMLGLSPINLPKAPRSNFT